MTIGVCLTTSPSRVANLTCKRGGA
jgi:hypothetical protein